MGKIIAKGFINKNGDQVEMIPTTHTHAIGDVTDLQTTLAEKANATHTHAIGDVTDLQTTLGEKANATHTHAITDVTNLSTKIAEINSSMSNLGGAITRLEELSQNPLVYIEIRNENQIMSIRDIFNFVIEKLHIKSYPCKQITLILSNLDENNYVVWQMLDKGTDLVTYLNGCAEQSIQRGQTFMFRIYDLKQIAVNITGDISITLPAYGVECLGSFE